ncbi:diguanylate cyclase [Vibrio sp. ZSDE26]|uniref:diguanylate cyclase n=1 Tax=Vibrio amylolyticus TaxID=2847292 RepID=A0A9X2BIZ1_9VIBR|nr:tetratricopeptide repeat-containing diguanylate cyclase [Vibrio amylolyticus]MCK6264635.1 diguanylate cyclase [Vibrio amylolyticus]
MMLTIITIEVFLFSTKHLSSPQTAITVGPETQLPDTPVGRELIRIGKLLHQDLDKAHLSLLALEADEAASWSTIESIVNLLLKRQMAKQREQTSVVVSLDQQLSQLANEQDIDWLKAQLLIEQAESSVKSGEVEQGIEKIVKAIEIAERIRAEFLLLRAYNTAGALYNASNKLKASQFYFYKGLELGKKYPTNEYNGRFYNNLGLLYVHLEQWEPALEYLKQAYVIFKASDNAPNERLLVVLFNQSFIYNKLNDPINARQAFHLALSYLHDDSSDYYHILKLKVEARLLILENQYQAALDTSVQCQNHPSISRYPKQNGICQFISAKALMSLESYSEALDSLEQGITTFTQISYERWLIRSYQAKAEIYEQLNRPAEALKIYKKYNAKEREQFVNEIYALEFAFDTQEVQKERDLLNVQNKLNALQLGKEKLRFRILSIWGAIGLLVLVFVIRSTLKVSNRNIELQQLSYQDPLTGVNNRRYYQNQIESGSKLEKGTQYRVVLIDLDWFKSINDTYGHDIGDKVLITTAKRLKQKINGDELLIRWGGEEFLCLLKESEDIESRVRSLLELISGEAYVTKAGELTITISVGSSKPNTIDTLRHDTSPFVEADTFLYQSKQNGRNQATFP